VHNPLQKRGATNMVLGFTISESGCLPTFGYRRESRTCAGPGARARRLRGPLTRGPQNQPPHALVGLCNRHRAHDRHNSIHASV